MYGAEELPAEEFSTGVASKEVVSTEVASKEVVSKEVVSKKEVLPASEEADSLLVLPVSGTSGVPVSGAVFPSGPSSTLSFFPDS